MTPTTQLTSLRVLSGAMIGAIAIITGVLALVAPDIALPQPWVIAVLLGAVAVAAIFSFIMFSQVPAARHGDQPAALIAKVQPVHMMRLALMETPVFLSIVLMFISPEPSWITVAIAAVPTLLLMLWLVFPHQGVLRRYEEALDAGGAHTRFADGMLGRLTH